LNPCQCLVPPSGVADNQTRRTRNEVFQGSRRCHPRCHHQRQAIHHSRSTRLLGFSYRRAPHCPHEGLWKGWIRHVSTYPCSYVVPSRGQFIVLTTLARGTGIVAAPASKRMLQMGGIQDCYSMSPRQICGIFTDIQPNPRDRPLPRVTS